MISLPKRKSIRLKHYDYSSSGWYYVTVCTQDRKCSFGEISGGEMILNDVGRMINEWWSKIPERFRNVALDEYQIMPNHFHGIVAIQNNGQTRGFARTLGDQSSTAVRDQPVGVDPRVDPNIDPRVRRPQQTLFKTIQWFKTMTTNHYIRGVKNRGWPPFNKRIWQRNYYEHIIRTEEDLAKIGSYIRGNPEMWHRDQNNPVNVN